MSGFLSADAARSAGEFPIPMRGNEPSVADLRAEVNSDRGFRSP